MLIYALLMCRSVSNPGILLVYVPWYSKRLLLITNNSFVYCSFLDTSKAFDRVHYCKLFRLLVKRVLPPCIVRILINLYTVSQVSVLWAGLASAVAYPHLGAHGAAPPRS